MKSFENQNSKKSYEEEIDKLKSKILDQQEKLINKIDQLSGASSWMHGALNEAMKEKEVIIESLKNINLSKLFKANKEDQETTLSSLKEIFSGKFDEEQMAQRLIEEYLKTQSSTSCFQEEANKELDKLTTFKTFLTQINYKIDILLNNLALIQQEWLKLWEEVTNTNNIINEISKINFVDKSQKTNLNENKDTISESKNTFFKKSLVAPLKDSKIVQINEGDVNSDKEKTEKKRKNNIFSTDESSQINSETNKTSFCGLKREFLN